MRRVARNPIALTRATPAKPNKRRARRPYDMRSAIGRRVKDLIRTFRERLGAEADDPVLTLSITRAAELQALAEDMRARALRGEPVAEHVVRLTRSADAAMRALGISGRNSQAKPPQLSSMDIVHDYIKRLADKEVLP